MVICRRWWGQGIPWSHANIIAYAVCKKLTGAGVCVPHGGPWNVQTCQPWTLALPALYIFLVDRKILWNRKIGRAPLNCERHVMFTTILRVHYCFLLLKASPDRLLSNECHFMFKQREVDSHRTYDNSKHKNGRGYWTSFRFHFLHWIPLNGATKFESGA